MDEARRFPWEDVEGMFDHWAGKPEFHWARNAWSALGKAGLTLFSDQIERTAVMVRIMTLATIYREFCHLAFYEEMDSPDYAWWADSLGISPFRIAQIVGRGFERGEADDCDESEHRLLHAALSELVDGNRRKVCEALVKGFGGESNLFYALWISPQGKPDGSEDHRVEPPEDVLLGQITDSKARAFSWITEGMPPIL